MKTIRTVAETLRRNSLPPMNANVYITIYRTKRAQTTERLNANIPNDYSTTYRIKTVQITDFRQFVWLFEIQTNDLTIDDITYLTCRGGWPWATLISKEVKLGGKDLIDEGAANMLKLSQRIDTDKMPSPSFMAVIIGVGNYAYQREDGVYVIPIGCLKD